MNQPRKRYVPRDWVSVALIVGAYWVVSMLDCWSRGIQ